MDLESILTVGAFRKKLLLLLAIFLLACGTMLASGLSQRQDEIVKAQNEALLVAQSLAAQQEYTTITTKTILGTLAQLPEVQRPDAPACNRIFQELQQRYPSSSIILASPPDGNMLAASSPFEAGMVNLADLKHIQEAIRTLDFSGGEDIIGRINKVLPLNYTFPVLDANQKFNAIVGGGYDMNEFSRFIEKTGKLPEGSSVVLMDHQGVLLHPWPQKEAVAVGKPVLPGFFKQISGGRREGYFDWLAQDSIYRTYAFKPLHLRENSPPYMYIGVGLPKDNILHEAHRKMGGKLSLLGLVALLAFSMLWILGDQPFIKPIDQLVAAGQSFGRGELNTRTGLPHISHELGRLAQSFDNLAGLPERRNLERQPAEQALELTHDELEQRIIECTAELRQTVEELHPEIESQMATQEPLLERERFRSLVENPDLGITLIGSDYRIMSNPAQGDFFHKQAREIIGKQCFWEFEKREAACPQCPRTMVMATGEKAEAETQWGRDDRSNFTVCVHETLRATLDAAPVAIFDLDAEGRVKSIWNAAAEQMLGWRRDEVLGQFLPTVPEEGKEEFARFRAWVRSGKPITGKDVVRRRKDGSLIEYSIYAAPEYDDRGRVIGNIAVLVDIAERKRAEEANKLNEARLTGLLRISQYQAESIQDLLNYALEEAIALTTSKIGYIYFYDDNSKQFTLNTWSREVMQEGTVGEPQTAYQLEHTGIWGEVVRQSRPIIVNNFLTPHPLKEGYPAGQALHRCLTIPVFANKRIVAVVGVANKATAYDEADVLQLTLTMDAVWKIVERRQAEEELRAGAHKWRTTFNAITDAVSLLDPEGTILECNQALADLVQKPFTDILGHPCHEVVHNSSQPLPDCPLVRMRETRQREESLLPMGNRWYKVGVDPILDEAGNLTGAVNIISDVTQLTETERKLYRRTQDLMMMNTIGSIVSRSLDLHKVLEDSLRMIRHNIFDDKSRAIVFLLDEATGELKAAGHLGVPEDHPCLGRPLKVGKCLCGRAALTGEMVVSRQGCANCAPGFLAPDAAPFQDISLPLKVRDRLLGVMHLSLSPDQEVDERHLNLLETIADQISVAVEQARLFEQVNHQGTQLRTLSARLAEIEEAERKVLARELHDQVGQSLTMLSLSLTMLQEQLPRMIPEKVQSRLTDALTLVEETADSVREIMAELRPPVLDDFGLMAAARWFGKQFSKRTGISLQATGEDLDPRLDRKVEMGVFRLIQEALNNVAKHAQASQVTVTQEVQDNRVRLTIADNGIGFDMSQVSHLEGRHRWGLMNMNERALAAGGTCRIESQPGQGTRVIVEVNR